MPRGETSINGGLPHRYLRHHAAHGGGLHHAVPGKAAGVEPAVRARHAAHHRKLIGGEFVVAPPARPAVQRGRFQPGPALQRQRQGGFQPVPVEALLPAGVGWVGPPEDQPLTLRAQVHAAGQVKGHRDRAGQVQRPGAEDHPAGRLHGDVQARHPAHLTRPGPGRVEELRGFEHAGGVVHPPDPAEPLNGRHGRVQQHPRPGLACPPHVLVVQAVGVHLAVGGAVAAPAQASGVKAGVPLGFIGGQGLGRNAQTLLQGHGLPVRGPARLRE